MDVFIRNSIVLALRKNALPGVVLQIFAAILVIIFYKCPSARPVFEWFGHLKSELGYVYAFVSTALFGGLIPFVYLWISGGLSPQINTKKLAIFYLLFWGYRGTEVDFFYRCQAHWFGVENNWQTIVSKSLVDQFIYSALWVAPFTSLIYLWVENNFVIQRWKQSLTHDFFWIKVPANIVSNWVIWLPAVAIIYTMPSQLQIPLFNLVLCFWVLMLAVLNKK